MSTDPESVPPNEVALERAAEALREREVELREALDRMSALARFPKENPDPVLRISAGATLVYANPAALAVLGDLLPGVGEPVAPPFAEPARLALSRGEPVTREIARGARTFLLTWSPGATDVNVYGHDISERRRVERALRQSEAQLRLFVEHAPAAVAMLDREMRYVCVSRRWLTDYRIGAQSVIGRSHYEVFPDLPERWKAIHERCLAGAVERSEADPFPRSDGTVDWVRWEIHPWPTVDGEIGGLIIQSEVINERRAAAEALRASEARSQRARERAQRLVEVSAALVGETSPGGLAQRIADATREVVCAAMAVVWCGGIDEKLAISASSGLARAPGMSLPMERGGVLLDLVEGRDTLRLTDAELLAHPRWWGLPEGHPPLRGLLGARLVARDGTTSGLILATAPAAGEFTAEDEALVRELAVIASLAAQHIDARVRLEEADRNKNQFLAMLSHELRNPLAPIRNSLFVLGRAAPGGEQAQAARAIIERQVDHMTRLVDDLLDVTRISRGKIHLLREPLDLRELLARVIEDHRPTFVAAGTELRASLGLDPVPVRADRTRLAQVVGNLLQNAAKFTPSGGRAWVTLSRDEAAGRALVQVSDTGVGIEGDVLARLFEPFVQAESTLDRSRGGLGLGLALVKGLVEMHGGSVGAASDGAGRGAVLTIRLPLEEGRPSPAPSRLSPRAADARRRVLVIDDNTDAAESLRDVLELDGHEVIVASDGPEGLAAARRGRPEVVICDIGLPGMDGYEVARTIRADEAIRATYLVALTGYARPEDLTRALEAGFDRHLAKPPKLDLLAEILAAVGQ